MDSRDALDRVAELDALGGIEPGTVRRVAAERVRFTHPTRAERHDVMLGSPHK
jgi:hypothetical protein